MKVAGLGCSFQKAFEYFKLSADQGDSRAQCTVGLYYERGLNVEKNFAMAFHYFLLAAGQEDGIGHYHVARFFRFRKTKNAPLFRLKRAICHYTFAQKQGFRVNRLNKIISNLMQDYQELMDQYMPLEFSFKNRSG
jgi:TPR repeat protein